ncbi:acyltransferase [Pseudomonas sp. UBA2684]|uniref:acyltransferase n=1 Tax=Pseudomonas sp. UBA2684 TaxID=1947311 RepID=UPI0025D19F61|nr:acyltransferase [Pseudomonas sp. UBA2684]
MKHRVHQSFNLKDQFPEYAAHLQVSVDELEAAWAWMLENEVGFEYPRNSATQYMISYVNLEKTIEHPLARRFFCLLRDENPAPLVPMYGLNLETLRDRCLRVWEQLYNIVINKIPSHTIRLAWLRLGGAKIGKGSTVWRKTEVLGIDGIRIGDDSVVAWDCLLDGRAGIIIGDHVTIASHSLLIAGGHDTQAPEFWAVGSPPIRIGDYAWIATRAMINAEVGEGAVVAGGSVVSRPVAPYTIVGGNPARAVGKRNQGLTYKVGGKSLFNLLH